MTKLTWRTHLAIPLIVLLAGAAFSAACGSTGNGGNGFGGESGDDDDNSNGGGGLGDDDDTSGGDDDGIGSVGDAGVPDPTHPDGAVSGQFNQDDCKGKTSAAQLKKGATVDSKMKWLYPYDNTVFPGGLVAPVLQWSPQSQGAADAVAVHLKSAHFDYWGCFGANSKSQLPIPQDVWGAAYSWSNGPGDPLKIELTTIKGSSVSGPISLTAKLAIGSLKGSVYYNTYSSAIAGSNGAVMQIPPGAAQPNVLLYIPGVVPTGPCVSCHSVSANGNIIVAQRHFYPGGRLQSESYDLSKNPKPDPSKPLITSQAADWGFSAVYPDGSRMVTDGVPNGDNRSNGQFFPAGPGENPGMEGPAVSQMFNPQTGQPMTMTGLPQHPQMPMFSPDGKMIVFTDYDSGKGKTLAVMDFDKGSNAFSNKKVIYTTTTANFAGWPFFTPDGKNVIFVLDSCANYASIAAPPLGPVCSSDLYIVNVASGVSRALDNANGIASKVPAGSRDLHLNFYPTVNPVAAGGFYWLYFTSRRTYGNIMTAGADDANSKKIWVSAIAAAGEAKGDPSSPPFYLPSQEAASGNIRAFASLDPCKKDGTSCNAGIDCCGGACTNKKCGAPVGCHKLDDVCTSDEDCCQDPHAPLLCLAGVCQPPIVVN